MNRLIVFSAASLLGLNAVAARAADDHSAHQHHAMPPEEGQTQPAAPANDHHSQGEAPTESEQQHVPPDPPQHLMQDMSKERMVELMQMEDSAPVGMVLLDQLEWRQVDRQEALQWDGQFWYGNDYDKVWFQSEGERVAGDYEGVAELFWDRIAARWWHVQAGVRTDFGEGPSRQWAAFGVQGLAPYWFELEATAYVGEQGRTAARFSGEYELLITQRLILQPKIEFQLYGKDDPENGVGSGLTDTELGLRLRYEIRREFAPYLGVLWTRSFGATADLARAAGDDVDDLQVVAGLRMWF